MNFSQHFVFEQGGKLCEIMHALHQQNENKGCYEWHFVYIRLQRYINRLVSSFYYRFTHNGITKKRFNKS